MSEASNQPNLNAFDFMTEREAARSGYWWSEKANEALAEKALHDPEFDYFANLPEHVFSRPKYLIGRYVLRHGISVPLVRSQNEWERTFDAGKAFLRSERSSDYEGASGLDQSIHLNPVFIYPEANYPPQELPRRDFSLTSSSPYESHRTYPIEGPALMRIHGPRLIQNEARNTILQATILDGLRSGEISFSEYADLLSEGVFTRRYNTDFETAYLTYSPWKKLDGINLSVMRDPVIEGKYYVGHRGPHHFIWTLENGRDSEDMAAYEDKTTHFRADDGRLSESEKSERTPVYTLPSKELVDLYETVRTLPYFDQRQAPVMEIQYDKNHYHFLQYLKTNRLITDPGEFELPSGTNVARTEEVIGATNPAGETMRVYIDTKPSSPHSKEGYFVSDNLHDSQRTALGARAIIWDHFLGFKDNHYTSAFLTRPPVTLATWDGKGDLEKAMANVQNSVREYQQNNGLSRLHDQTAYYINATITSNGRAATVESDWKIRND